MDTASRTTLMSASWVETSQQCIPGAAAADNIANKESFSLKHPAALHLGRFSLCNKGEKTKRGGEKKGKKKKGELA